VKIKISDCPFCGGTPSGKKFCSTSYGPVLVCDQCGSNGPHPLSREFVGGDDAELQPLALRAWNKRANDRESWKNGVRAAADFVEQFDRYVDHSHRLSDVILCKFNMLAKRKVRKRISPTQKRARS